MVPHGANETVTHDVGIVSCIGATLGHDIDGIVLKKEDVSSWIRTPVNRTKAKWFIH